MDNDSIGNALELLAILGFVAFLIWYGYRAKVDRRRLKLEEQNMILDRLGNSDNLNEFLQTEQGKKFLDRLNEDDRPDEESHKQRLYRMGVIGLMTAGMITLMVSLGLFFAANLSDFKLIVPASIIGGVSIGCLLAAWVQHILGRKWGMLGDETGNGRSRLEVR